MPWRVLSAKVREQPHFVLGPKSACHESGPCGAKRGVRLRQGYGETSPKLEERRRAPFAATRERTLHLADTFTRSCLINPALIPKARARAARKRVEESEGQSTRESLQAI